jgi:branched-subunit amino acid ABC-type transport system permease component
MFDQIQQLALVGAVNGSFYALLGVGFALILGVTGRFHYAYALIFTFAAYVTSVLSRDAGVPLVAAVAAGMMGAALAGVAIEAFVYRPLARSSGALSLLTVLISSLGVTIVGVNLITLAWSAASRSIVLVPLETVRLGSATLTTLDLILVVSAWGSILLLGLLLGRTQLGRSILAVRGNPNLARMMGIDPDRIYRWVFAIGSLLCALAGILNGARYAVLPDMGSRPVVYAFVVAFLGGTRSPPWVVGVAGLAIGMVESLSGLWVSPQWSSLVVFSVLFGYLALRPVGLGYFLPRRRA